MEHLTRAQIEQMMQKVLDVRYTDLELEKALCVDLLRWGTANGEFDVIAFAHTYLGDYYVAHCDGVPCATHLMEARPYIEKCEEVRHGSLLLDALRSQCWCQYYAAVDDLASAAGCGLLHPFFEIVR